MDFKKTLPQSTPSWLRQPPEDAALQGHCEAFSEDGEHVGVQWDLRDQATVTITPLATVETRKQPSTINLDARFLLQLSRSRGERASIERVVGRDVHHLHVDLRQTRARVQLTARTRSFEALEGLPWKAARGARVPFAVLQSLSQALVHATEAGELANWQPEDTRDPSARRSPPPPRPQLSLWQLIQLERARAPYRNGFAFGAAITFVLTSFLVSLLSISEAKFTLRLVLGSLIVLSPSILIGLLLLWSPLRRRRLFRHGQRVRAQLESVREHPKGLALRLTYELAGDSYGVTSPPLHRRFVTVPPVRSHVTLYVDPDASERFAWDYR